MAGIRSFGAQSGPPAPPAPPPRHRTRAVWNGALGCVEFQYDSLENRANLDGFRRIHAPAPLTEDCCFFATSVLVRLDNRIPSTL
jgi:hypothetical protein